MQLEQHVQRAAKRLLNNPDYQLVIGALIEEYKTALLSTADDDHVGREGWFRKFRAVEDILNFTAAQVDEGKRVEDGR